MTRLYQPSEVRADERIRRTGSRPTSNFPPEIFALKQIRVDWNGRSFGEFIATGVRPTFMDRLEQAGYQLTADLFRARTMLTD